MESGKKYRDSSARLRGWDYRNEGRYFITICTAGMFHFFGKCSGGFMNLSDTGKMAFDFWEQIPDHFPNTALDVFQVMPNHIHGIILLTGEIITPRNIDTINRDSIRAAGKNQYFQAISPKAGSIAAIIRSYKSICTKEINLNFKDSGFAWQPRYHDHVIRNDEEYFKIRNYIINNPKNWEKDKFFGDHH